MDNSKKPNENTYGARVIEKTRDLKYTKLSSILSDDQELNGHINRNIRV